MSARYRNPQSPTICGPPSQTNARQNPRGTAAHKYFVFIPQPRAARTPRRPNSAPPELRAARTPRRPNPAPPEPRAARTPRRRPQTQNALPEEKRVPLNHYLNKSTILNSRGLRSRVRRLC